MEDVVMLYCDGIADNFTNYNDKGELIKKDFKTPKPCGDMVEVSKKDIHTIVDDSGEDDEYETGLFVCSKCGHHSFVDKKVLGEESPILG